MLECFNLMAIAFTTCSNVALASEGAHPLLCKEHENTQLSQLRPANDASFCEPVKAYKAMSDCLPTNWLLCSYLA